MKIAVIVNPFTLRSKGGAHGPTLARMLQERGHSVRGFGAPGSEFPGLEVAEDEKGLGVVAFEPELIIAYDGLSPAAWVGAKSARKLGVPLMLVEAGFSGDGPIHERFLRKTGEAVWGRFIRKVATSVVALDPFALELARSEGFPPDRVTLLPGGVDLEHFRPGLSSSLLSRHRVPGRVLLYVGRIDERRGLEVLIDAFARTVGQRRDWSLVLAGEGAARRRLRAHGDRLGIGSRIHWLPGPSAEELPGLMCSATLLAVPAIDSSVRGKQIPRALACGVPVLVSDLPRFGAWIRDDESGLLVPPGDVEAWTGAIQRAASAPVARKRWGTRGRELAEQCFDWRGIAESFERLARAALNAQPELERLESELESDGANPAPAE